VAEELFSWEEPPAEQRGPAFADLVVVPDVFGAYDVPNVRDSRDQLARQIVESTDGSTAARSWAAEKAAKAAATWDRGVSSGTITPRR